MKENKTTAASWEQKLDQIGERLKAREITLPTDMIGAGLFIIIGIILLMIMPSQVPVSDTDVVNGRAFPTMLMVLMIVCSGILLIKNMIKMAKKEPMHTCTVNLLTEVKALIILGILFVTYLVCRLSGLFVIGAVFCSLAFLVYFRCKKKLYYGITVGMAVAIWAAFRFLLGVIF